MEKITLVLLNLRYVKHPNRRVQQIGGYMGLDFREQGRRENCIHIQIGWVKFPKGSWVIRREKRAGDRTIQDREDEIGPTGKPRSRKRNVTAKMANFIEHYSVMAQCQYYAKWFFMNYPSALHNLCRQMLLLPFYM